VVNETERHRLLGEVLVVEGLLTKDQLAEALAEQDRSGRRLGEILVSSELVSAPAVAMALADQRGGLVRSEYGWATGWRAVREPRRETSASASPASPPAAVGAPDAAARHEQRDEVEALKRELARVTQELQAERSRRAADTPAEENGDAGDFVMIAVVDGRYAVHLGRGKAPPAGKRLRLPGLGERVFAVARETRRRCLYLEPVDLQDGAPT